MQEIERKFREKMRTENWDAETAAKQLKVSRASFYKYLGKTDLPSFEVLKRAHDLWGISFNHIDFAASHPVRVPPESELPRQFLLPFLEAVDASHVQILRAKPIKPDMLELTVRIRFVG